MDSKKLAKLGVVVIFILAILYAAGMILLFALGGAPGGMIVVVAVVGLIILSVLCYVSVQRFKEINEGLEDAVDDY